MAQSGHRQAFTTARVSFDTAEELHDIKEEHGDPNLDRTVRRLIDHYQGAP